MPIRSFNLVLTLGIACQLAFVIANTLMAHYARWISFLGGSVQDIGMITGTGALIGLLFRPWMGQWINRLGAKNTWAAGYLCFALGTLGNLAIHQVDWAIFALRALLMMGGALVFTSSLTYIAQIAPVERRTESIGFLGIGGFLGMMVGPFCGDLLLQTRERSDFITLFLIASAALVVGLALIWLLPPVDVPPSKHRGRQFTEFVKTVATYWPGWILLVNTVFGVCMTVPFVFLADFIDTDRIDTGRWSELGLFFLCYAGMGLTLRVGLSKLPNLIGRRKVLLCGMTCMGTGLMCFRFVDADHSMWIMLPALLCGAGHGLSFHTLTSLTIERFPVEVRGTGSALCLMMLDIGQIGGPPVLALAAESVGFTTSFAMIGVLVVVVGLVYAGSSVPIWRDQLRIRREWLADKQSGESKQIETESVDDTEREPQEVSVRV